MADVTKELELRVNAEASKANDAIDRLVGKLDNLTNSLSKVQGTNLSGLANGVQRLGTAMQSMNAIKTADFTRLATNLSRLGKIDTASLNNTASSMSHLTRAFNTLGGVSQNAVQVGELAKNISKLGYKSVQTAITNIPKLATALNGLMTTLSKSPQVSQNVIQLVNALANLSAQGSRIGSASRAASNYLNRTNNVLKTTKNSTLDLAHAIGKFYAKWFLVIRGIKSAWKNVESSMDYVETSNYFNVALSQIGQQFESAGYENAERYTEALNERLKELNKKLTGYTTGEAGEALFSGDIGLGMDIEKMMNFQAKTLAVTNSVGLLGNASVETAKAVSMLAGDLSSLTNMDIDSVMTNLSSGLVGNSRSLYKFGIDITNNTLQQYALAEGIEKAVSEMTQSEKMQLRVLAILDQSKVSYADLANTINSVANQYRVFDQQMDNLARTMGNLLLPVVKNVLPYVTGLVIALNNLFISLGFKIYGETWLKDLQDGISGGVQEGFEDTEEAIENTTDAIKEFKNGVRGFDMLNVLSSGTKKSSGISDELQGTIDLTESISKAVSDYESLWDAAMEDMNNKAQEISETVTPFLENVATAIENIYPLITGLAIVPITVKIADWAIGVIDACKKLAFYFASHPLAVTIGAIVALGTAVKKTMEQVKAGQMKSIFNAFMDGADDSPIKDLEDITDAFSKLKDTVTQDYTDIINKINGISGTKVTIGNTIGTIGSLQTSFQNAAISAKEAVEKITESFKSLLSGSKIIFDQEYEVIVNGIAGPLGDTLKAMGVDNSKLLELLSKTRAGLKTTLDGIAAEQKALEDAWSEGNISAEEYFVGTQRLAKKLSDLSVTKTTTEATKERLKEIASSFDVRSIITSNGVDVNKLSSFMQELTQIYTDGKKEIDAGTKAFKESLNDYYYYAGQIIDVTTKEGMTGLKEIKKAIDSAESASEIEADKLAEYYSTIFASMQNQIVSAVPDVIAQAKEQWENMGAGKKALYEVLGKNEFDYLIETTDAYVKQWKEVTGIIQEEMQSVGIESNVLESNLDNILDEFWGKIKEGYNVNLFSGEKIKDYLGTGEYKELFEEVAKSYENNAEKVSESNKKFQEETKKSAEAVANSFDNAMEKLEKFGSAFQKLNGSSAVVNIKVNTPNSVGFLGFPKLPQYAVGGFPEDGLFMANSGELVGKFSNGKTAVANNDQIISGIKEGVYEAVLSAISTSSRGNSSGDIVINMDGKEVFSVVRNRANEFYRRTGNPAFEF